MQYDRTLLQWATPIQRKYLEAVEKHGSQRKAAKALCVTHSSVGKSLKRLEKRAAREDPNFHSDRAPEGYDLRGVSTLRRDDQGNLQWVKTERATENRLEILKEAMEEITETHTGRLKPLKKPAATDPSMLAVYPIADPHLGLICRAAVSGEDFNLEIAEEMMRNTFDALIQSVPKTDLALFMNLGDWCHVDNSKSQTTWGNYRPSSGDYELIVRAGFRVKRWIIDRLLQHHGKVIAWVLGGNHDRDTSVLLGLALEALYDKESRLSIEVSASPFRMLEFGNVLIGSAHGDRISAEGLGGVMSSNWPEEWGRTKHRVWYTGHVHHDSVKEVPGCLVESVRTIAPKTSWEFSRGYNAMRDLKCDLWHKSEGRCSRVVRSVIGAK